MKSLWEMTTAELRIAFAASLDPRPRENDDLPEDPGTDYRPAYYSDPYEEELAHE